MSLLINFDATEYGGTDSLKMQGSADGGATWIDAMPYVSLTNGSVVVDDSFGLAIDTTVFIPGNTYVFRLIDQDGVTISNTLTYTIPSIIETEAGVEIEAEAGQTIGGS